MGYSCSDCGKTFPVPAWITEHGNFTRAHHILSRESVMAPCCPFCYSKKITEVA